MAIPIHIPLGMRYQATSAGAVWKLVRCEQCSEPYGYLLTLEASGSNLDLLFLDQAGSIERAREQAQRNLEKKGINCVLPVPCPQCGFYQADMASQLKDDASINVAQVIGMLFVLAASLPPVFDLPYGWYQATSLGGIGVMLLVRGYVSAFCYDANDSDPEIRKQQGRECAIWGEPLTQLIATTQTTLDPSGKATVVIRGGEQSPPTASIL